MSRSLKKGPFVANHLLKKVQKLNDQDDKKLSKLGHDHLQLSQL
jgi:small subunit ribosomal protein S19